VDSVFFVGPLDRVLLLRTLPILEGLGPIQIAAIAQHARERLLERDTVLQVGDGATEAILLVIDGELEVNQHGVMRTLRSGAAVGFLEMLSPPGPKLEVRACVDTTTLELDWDAQIDVCEEHFAVVTQYIGFVAKQTVDRLRRLSPESRGLVPLIDAQKFGQPLNLLERTLVLSRSQAISSRCMDALFELAHHVKEVRWHDGEQVWASGDPSDYFLLVAAGTLRCDSASGSRFDYGAGNALGMYEALCKERRWHSTTSQGDSVGLKIDVEPFMDILEDHFDLALDLLAALAGELLRLEQAGGALKTARSDAISDFALVD
jgi:CRP-like cAMP-binding protein